jgi:acyl carrier protein
MEFDQALSLLYSALQTVNELRPPDDAIAQDPDIVLVGDDGVLDSLGITTLILSLENRLRDAGRDVALLEGDDFESEMSRFRTPATIARLIVNKTAA